MVCCGGFLVADLLAVMVDMKMQVHFPVRDYCFMMQIHDTSINALLWENLPRYFSQLLAFQALTSSIAPIKIRKGSLIFDAANHIGQNVMQGFQGFPGSPQNLTFGSIQNFPGHPGVYAPQEMPPHYFSHMQRPPQGVHQGFEGGYPPPYGMPGAHLGFQPGAYPPTRGGYPQQQQQQHRGGMSQPRGYQGSHPGASPNFRSNQPNPSKRPAGQVPQQNGSTTPQPAEKRGSRLSIVNPETNKEIEIPPQNSEPLSLHLEYW